uniref:C3H1-type domain-containing protein n=1 Tax=Noctiluca scintillans TaxID=2966 RepID=A0A7S0ZMD3_NOCSC|mmetsp:Transcript_10709/g.29785  ORF Transcript_10709/g.29785 Transcript_10709/m.29785 type:complete len:117 (+) Transcript_10709:97-447(+)
MHTNSAVSSSGEMPVDEFSGRSASGVSSLQPADDPVSESEFKRLHELGRCNPCIFFSSPIACPRGNDCRYCHLHQESSSSQRANRQLRTLQRKEPQRVVALAPGARKSTSPVRVCL